MKTLHAWKCLASATDEALAEAVRKYHLPDSSHWKNHAVFEDAFAQPSLKLRRDKPSGKRFARLDFVAADVRRLIIFR